MELPPSATSIPSVSALRQSLDYGDPSLGRVKAFISDLRSFTQRYMTSLGIRGSDIIDWRSPEHGEALREVTNAWLEEVNCGVIYWPHDPNHANFNRYQYLLHENYIKTIVMQLIFKANKNANQNQKYKAQHRRPQAPGTGSLAGTSEDPIEIESLEDSRSTLPSACSWRSDATEQTFSPTGSAMQPPSHQVTPIIHTTNREQLNEPNRDPPIDPYLVPTSREPTPQQRLQSNVVALRVPNELDARTEGLGQIATPASTTTNELHARDKRRTSSGVSANVSVNKGRQLRTRLHRPSYVLKDPEANSPDGTDDTDDTARPNNRTPNASDNSGTITRGLEKSNPRMIRDSTSEDGNVFAADSDRRQPNLHGSGLTSTNTNASSTVGTAPTASGRVEPDKSSERMQGISQSTSTEVPVASTSREQDPRAEQGKRPQFKRLKPLSGVKPIVDIVDEDENIIGRVRKIQPRNKSLQHLLSLPIQRSVRIRPGRRFTQRNFNGVHNDADPKRTKWVSCMIQAVGTVQSQRCSNCQKNQGAFAECVIIGGPLFPKCGNCEWNHHGCHIITENDTPQQSTENTYGIGLSSRVGHAQTPPTNTSGEDRDAGPSNATARREQLSVTMDIDEPANLNSAHQADNFNRAVVSHISTSNYQPPRVETEQPDDTTSQSHQIHTSQHESTTSHQPPTTTGAEKPVDTNQPQNTASSHIEQNEATTTTTAQESNPRLNKEPNAQSNPRNQDISIFYNVILSRTPLYKDISWTPKGSFGSKSLSELTDEIPLSLSADTKGFRFTFMGPFIEIMREIKPGQDHAFEILKAKLNDAVQDSIQQAAIRGLPLVFELHIEEVLDDSLGVKGKRDKEFSLWN